MSKEKLSKEEKRKLRDIVWSNAVFNDGVRFHTAMDVE